jgi:hypothetical protein
MLDNEKPSYKGDNPFKKAVKKVIEIEKEDYIMATENKLYYVTDINPNTKLIDDNGELTQRMYQSIALNEETSDKLLALLSNYNNDLGHLCISVYRDAIILNGDIYNICLSCGDYYKNDEEGVYYIRNRKEIIELLKEFKI